jgi:hypothetical protein
LKYGPVAAASLGTHTFRGQLLIESLLIKFLKLLYGFKVSLISVSSMWVTVLLSFNRVTGSSCLQGMDDGRLGETSFIPNINV